MISPFIRLFGFSRLRQKKIVKAWKNLHILESFIFQHQKTKESVFIHFIVIKKVKSCPIGYTGREESCMNNYKILVYEIEVEDGDNELSYYIVREDYSCILELSFGRVVSILKFDEGIKI